MSNEDGTPDDGVMIAFLPTSSDWCKLDLPHMTLVYAGSKADLTPTDFNELCKDAADIALLTPPFTLDVMSMDVFGPENDRVNVLRLRPTAELTVFRSMVERWNKSEHPFNPHCTIGPATDLAPIYPPTILGFDRIIVAFGEERIQFFLRPRY